MKFKKILVANRGEIAVRIIRGCKELNIPTVAIHSDVDKDAMHVRLAEESICIGSHKPQNSYLNIAAIMTAADVTGADAIHPGYGFLSENFHFAEIVTKSKIKFIGPSSEIMKKMGDKVEAKKIAKKFGLPVIEGSEETIKSLEEAKKITKDDVADELGGLPPIKMHCSNLAAEALNKAIEDYKNKPLKKVSKDGINAIKK